MAETKAKLEDIRKRLKEWRTESESGNKSFFRRGTKSSRFKVGSQWDADDLAYQREHRKHACTVNQVLPIVNFLDGEQVRNPRDLTAVAYKGGNAVKARLLTALMKQVCDSSHGRHQQADAFDAGVTTGRGYLGIDTSYLTDPLGDLCLRTYGTFSVLPDPHRKRYDPNDWNDGWRYVFLDEWFPKAMIDAQYPAKKSDLAHARYGGSAEIPGWFGRIVSHLFPGNEAWDNHDDYRDPNQAEDPEPETRTKWEDHYRVSTCYWRDWRKGACLQRVDAPDWFVVLHRPQDIARARRLLAETEAAGEQAPVQLIERDGEGRPLVVPVLMRTSMVGDVLLDHTEDPFDGTWQYPLVPFNAYFEDGYEFGVVDNLIGPQEICNWAWSMTLNIIKKLANTGWRIKKALTSSDKQWLERSGTEDGIIIDESQFGGKVEKIEPTPYPASFHNVTQQSSLQMREIANVRTERPEFDQKNMSGIAIARKQASSDQGAAPVFSNWDMTLEIVGGVLIEQITRRRTYSRAEILQIIDEEDLLDAELLARAKEAIITSSGLSPLPPQAPPAQVLAAAQPQVQALLIAQYQQHLQAHLAAWQDVERLAPEMAVNMLLDELEEIRQGKTKFGVRSSLSESANTFREMNFAQMAALDEMLRARGEPGVPRDELIKASDVPHKEQILQQKPQMQPAMAAQAA
jgi:hypothetical protein